MKLNKKYIKNKYNRDGFIIIKKILSKSEAKLLKKELLDTIKDNKSKFRKRYINFTKNNSINSMHGLDNFDCVKKLQQNSKVKDVVKTLIGTKYDKFGSELFAKPAKYGLPVPIHQDNKYWCLDTGNALTMWFALDESSEQNGGVYYYKGSHKLGMLEHVSSFAPGSSQKIKYNDGLNVFSRELPKLNIGDCLIHQCMVVHGSKANKSAKARTGLTLRYKHSSNFVRKDLKKSYEKELRQQISLR